VAAFVEQQLGRAFVDAQAVSLEDACRDADARTPVIFVLSQVRDE